METLSDSLKQILAIFLIHLCGLNIVFIYKVRDFLSMSNIYVSGVHHNYKSIMFD